MRSGYQYAGRSFAQPLTHTLPRPRSMEIVTPLGEDILLFHRMQAREELSRSSEYFLELLSDPDTVIDFDDILGKNVTVKVTLRDDSVRHFNGFVTRFAAAGRHGRYLRFTATVSPWAWFLTRTSDCRIFQDKTVREILEDVFADHSMADFRFELTETYEKWAYCVQYRETDFNFVSRLLEHEGIYYYYRHIDGAHTMVLTDSIDGHQTFPGYEQIPFIGPQGLVRPDIEHIHSWEFSRQVQPGVLSLHDYDFERPSVDLRLERLTPRTYAPSDYEWFDYPGLFTKKPRGEQLAQVRGEEFGSQFERAVAVTDARGVAVGSIFTLEKFAREDQNRGHLIVSSVHELDYSEYEAMPGRGGSSVNCRFEALTTTQPFRPQRITPKPFVQGPQTAVVVGPAGEEIYTDNCGRVKVQFHWDSRGTKNEDSSCWIRVSHPWAGKGWGAIAIPRIGQEVVVDFLEGDPDQPIITGRVYNAEQVPPYALPAHKTQTGMKSRSSIGGSPANSNEIRFEDKAGSEQLFIHAEKNQDIEVEQDETHWVGHNRQKTIDHDETTRVTHDRAETVGHDETITIGVNRTETVGAEETVAIGGNRTMTVNKNETATVALTRTHTVGINELITIGGAQEITVGSSQVTTIGQYLFTAVGGARSSDIGTDDALRISKNWVVDAGDSVTIMTGKASIVMKKDGTISLAGTDISVQGSGTITVKASGETVIEGRTVNIN